jgi:transcriptional regulator with XRE-family HTH domain
VTIKPYLRLRLERHLRCWTQKDVARASGIPQQIISAIESGRLNPTPDELDRLAHAFRVSPAELLLQPVALQDAQTQEAAV